MNGKLGFKFSNTICLSHFEWNMIPFGVGSKKEIFGKCIGGRPGYNGASETETIKMTVS